MPKKFGSLSSSADPAKLSLTIKAIIASLLPIVKSIFGWEIGSEQTDSVIDAIFVLITAGIAIYGYARSRKVPA